MTHAPPPRRAGASLVAGFPLPRFLALAAAATAFAVGGGTAYGQDPVETMQEPAQTAPTEPTQTTPTETTPTETTPTETTPAPTSPEPTSGANEYVETLPSGGGQTPAAQSAPAPASETPDTAPVGPAEPVQATPTDEAERKAKPQRKERKRKPERPTAAERPAQADTRAPLPATPVAAEAGEPASPWLLGIALLLTTGVVVGTAVARRQGAAA